MCELISFYKKSPVCFFLFFLLFYLRALAARKRLNQLSKQMCAIYKSNQISDALSLSYIALVSAIVSLES